MADEKKRGEGTSAPEEAGERARRAGRRKFLTRGLLAGLAVVTTGAVADRVSRAVIRSCLPFDNEAYISRGERIMTGRTYVEMTEEEKREMLAMMLENYEKEEA